MMKASGVVQDESGDRETADAIHACHESSMSEPSPEKEHEEVKFEEVEEPLAQGQDLRRCHPWPHLEIFYGPVLSKNVVSEKGKLHQRGTIACKKCKAKVSYNTYSLYTLKSHYSNMHPEHMNDLLAAISSGSKRGRSQSRLSGGEVKYSKTKRMRPNNFNPNISGSSISAFNLESQDSFQSLMLQEMLPGKFTEALSSFLRMINPSVTPSDMGPLRTAERGKHELISVLEQFNVLNPNDNQGASSRRQGLDLASDSCDTVHSEHDDEPEYILPSVHNNNSGILQNSGQDDIYHTTGYSMEERLENAVIVGDSVNIPASNNASTKFLRILPKSSPENLQQHDLNLNPEFKNKLSNLENKKIEFLDLKVKLLLAEEARRKEKHKREMILLESQIRYWQEKKKHLDDDSFCML